MKSSKLVEFKKTKQYEALICPFDKLHEKIELKYLIDTALPNINKARADKAQSSTPDISRDVAMDRLQTLIKILNFELPISKSLFPQTEDKEAMIAQQTKINQLALYAFWYELNCIEKDCNKNKKWKIRSLYPSEMFKPTEKLHSITYKSIAEALGFFVSINYEGAASNIEIEENKPDLKMQLHIYEQLKQFVQQLIFKNGDIDCFHLVEYKTFDIKQAKSFIQDLTESANAIEKQLLEKSFENEKKKQETFQTSVSLGGM